MCKKCLKSQVMWTEMSNYEDWLWVNFDMDANKMRFLIFDWKGVGMGAI